MIGILNQSRFARPVLYAAAFTFSMFWTMHLLIAGGKYIAQQGESLSTVDFVRLKKESELETRERKKPPKPEPPKTPPPPKMKVEAPPPDAPQTAFTMPKLDLPTTITGGPFMGSYVAGDNTGYSDLIPLVRIQPQYPRSALRDGIEGTVVFEVTINPDGTVKKARAISANPRGVFEAAAMSAIMKWKFKPKIVDGKGVETIGRQPIDFKMAEEEK
jgi:periplasmic protein TonB